MKMKVIAACVFLFSVAAQGATDSLFDPGTHCVAYRTYKRMFLLRTVTVVGKNCEVSSQVIPEIGDKYYIELSVPVEKFQSGESERDRDVAKILKAEVQPNLIFRSEKLTRQQWQERVGQKSFSLNGEMEIGKKPYPVVVQVSLQEGEGGVEADGFVRTKFESFELNPPKLFLGLMASVKEDLELHFHLLSRKTLGIDSLLSQ